MTRSKKLLASKKALVKKTLSSAIKTQADRWLLGGVLLLVVTVLLTVLIVLTVGKARLLQHQNYTAKIARSNTAEGVKNATVAVHVDVVGFDEKGIPSMEPSEGNINILLKVKIKNISKRNLDFYPSIQSYIRDSQGGYYTMRPAMSRGVPLEAGQIKPGETLEGELSYEVSKHLVQPRYYLDANWDGGPMVFDLRL